MLAPGYGVNDNEKRRPLSPTGSRSEQWVGARIAKIRRKYIISIVLETTILFIITDDDATQSAKTKFLSIVVYFSPGHRAGSNS
jgi:hypothetical protein